LKPVPVPVQVGPSTGSGAHPIQGGKDSMAHHTCGKEGIARRLINDCGKAPIVDMFIRDKASQGNALLQSILPFTALMLMTLFFECCGTFFEC
jgi:hypothetical protein